MNEQTVAAWLSGEMPAPKKHRLAVMRYQQLAKASAVGGKTRQRVLDDEMNAIYDGLLASTLQGAWDAAIEEWRAARVS